MHTHGERCGLATRSETLEQLGIRSQLRVTIDAQRLGCARNHEDEPDPGIFLHTTSLLEMPTNRCLVIEDSVNGVAAAKSAGMTCVAITNTFHRSQLRHADLVVDSLLELSFVRLHDLALRRLAQSAMS